ncbi:c551b015-08ff-4813-bc07-dcf87efa97a4 [Sclerotinia trifoliorum]|uniref:C551b015-08ff-4813-bc07-dcf87efa97a4 n=1 Tax=Sclerotinia trifoliorum TaxID=28548 RepID=A0A8H2W5N7_9HELO|nr:c551b015-08ff-4813-bc07-dcf87efa97a4 [Sclerotinia trifoliorum]
MDNTMEDDDVDMPYAPSLQQATASRCPYTQASRNSMHRPNYPALMNPWTGYREGFNMPTSMYGTPSMASFPYGGANPSYLTTGYATQHAQWSQNAHAQGNTFSNIQDPQHQNLEPSGSSRPFPPMSVPADYHSWPGLWPNEPRPMPVFAEENTIADNNNNPQGMTYTGNSVAGVSREQVQQRRRERESQDLYTSPAANSEAFGNASLHTTVPASTSEWDQPTARQARRLAEVQRRATLARASYGARYANRDPLNRDSDTDEEDLEYSDDDDNLEAILGYSQIINMTNGGGTLAAVLRGRGGAAGKRMPSKEFLLSLETLNPSDLSEEDRSCIICYNEFGVKNPEGVSEQPLRLPKCRHIFGAICIKKWFKENDSCPYCRDKVPSESAAAKIIVRHARQLMRDQRDQRDQMRNRLSATARSTEAGHLNPSALNSQESQSMTSGDRTPPVWSRPSTTETVESRRRVSRGRTGSHRAAHLSTRPNPMTSARLYTPTSPSQLQNEVSPQTHLRHNSNAEGVSPAIAVGSPTNSRDHQPTPLSVNSLGNSANSNSYMGPNSSRATSSISNSYMPPFAPSYSQTSPIAFGSMRTPTFDPTQNENAVHHYNFQPQIPQQDDSTVFQSQQQTLQQYRQQVFDQQAHQQREIEQHREREMREVERRANEQQFHSHGNMGDY